MSFAWAFYSVSQADFEGHFLGPHPEKLEAFTSALTWDEGAFDEESAQQIAEHLAEHGLNYADLDEDRAALLDEAVPMLISEEGVGSSLQRVPESPEFVHPFVIESLLRAAKVGRISVLLLPILESGRRYGATGPTEGCNYCVLSPSEAESLALELSTILGATKDWGKEEYMPELVRKCLIGPLEKANKKKRALLGVLG